MKLEGRIGALLVLGMFLCMSVSLVPSVGAAVPILFDAIGFEDDVDLVVSPEGGFMVVSEETEDGEEARVRILSLDALTGEPLDFVYEESVLGFENGVDPIILHQAGGAFSFIVLVPVENEDGSEAEVIVLATDWDGDVVDDHVIPLGDLGFRQDVDGVFTNYPGMIALFPLESEDRTERGVLVIDADISGDGDWGSCLLLSTDGRRLCEENEDAEWLPNLAVGVDPIAYELDFAARLALPVVSDSGNDLLFLDFESDTFIGDAPQFLGYSSVQEINDGGDRPLVFPGYELDVDMRLLGPDQCGVDLSLVVPVEGSPDFGDLYRIDAEFGHAIWVYSMDSGSAVSLPGYEAGVDIVPMCDLALWDPEDRLAVPVENSAGTDGNLLIIELEHGLLLASVEDPALNPGMDVPGYEVGVDLVRWTENSLAVPVEGPVPPYGLFVFRPDGLLIDSLVDASILGFQRSVDPIVAPVGPPALVVPVGTDDGSDADIMVFTNPPNLDEVFSLETVTGLELGRFEVDVDLGLVDKSAPGGQYLCIAEEGPDEARLRFEPTTGRPGRKILAVVTETSGARPSSLYFFDLVTQNLLFERNNLLGIETGLDMVDGRGPVTPGEFTVFFPVLPGIDWDFDPTVIVSPRIPEDLEELIDVIEGLDLDDFFNIHHMKALVNKVEAVIGMVEAGDLDSLCEAIQKLENDILRKTDGEKPPRDWVIDPAAQQMLEDMIIAIIDQLQDEVDALGGCSQWESSSCPRNGCTTQSTEGNGSSGFLSHGRPKIGRNCSSSRGRFCIV